MGEDGIEKSIPRITVLSSLDKARDDKVRDANR